MSSNDPSEIMSSNSNTEIMSSIDPCATISFKDYIDPVGL
jgi:hypothetical protein